jgi:TatA/E family protein of Tat protein translocase
MVVAVALLVFGPKRIPEIAASMGKGIREFRKSIAGSGSDDLTGLPDTPPPAQGTRSAQSDATRDQATIPAEGNEPKRLLS